MNAVTTVTRTNLLRPFGGAVVAGTLAAVVLGAPAWAMHRPTPETATTHDLPAVAVFTGGHRPGAYLLVKTPMP